jgi:hypothetical protein
MWLVMVPMTGTKDRFMHFVCENYEDAEMMRGYYFNVDGRFVRIEYMLTLDEWKANIGYAEADTAAEV